MIESLTQTLQHYLQASPWPVYPLVCLLGTTTGLNPCVLPTIPVVPGYIGGHAGYSTRVVFE